jgi:cytochrome P450
MAGRREFNREINGEEREIMLAPAPTYDPRTPGFMTDPYPHYALLRAENPVHLTRFRFVILTRHAQLIAAYQDPRLSRNIRLWDDFSMWRRGRADGPLETMMDNWLVMIDPPRHTAMRAIHERVFSAKLFAATPAAITEIIDGLLLVARDSGGFDLVADFADRLPVYLICSLLDLPRADWPQFVSWSRAIALTTETFLPRSVLREGEQARAAMAEYLEPLARKRRRQPGDDVLSGLAVTEAAGKRLTDEELIDSLIFLYQAGHPTSTQLIALAVHSLLVNPGQLARLRADPGLLPGAVEELARYDGPVQMNDRVATEDMSLYGLDVKRGQLVRLCIGAANRDEDRYPDPERLDLGRTASHQLGYGHGMHSCVAAHLGGQQAQAAIGALARQAPALRIAAGAEPRFRPSMSNRGLSELLVEF